MNPHLRHLLAPLLTSVLVTTASATLGIGFEDLSFVSGNFENGANLSGTTVVTNDPFGPGGSLVTTESDFASTGSGITGNFANTYNEFFDGPDGTGTFQFDFWSGWAYSKNTDTVTPGVGNQYSAVAGSGAGGSLNYGIANGDVTIGFGSVLDFTGRGIDVTNTTYAHHSMRDGDFFGKKFGDDPATTDVVETDVADWFRLTVEGFLSGGSTGTVEFYLADFRFADDADDYLVDAWRFVDLSSLGLVDQLGFDLSSSDTGAFGMNTPDYFAIDNIGAVPEPAAVALVAGVLALLVAVRSRRR